METATGSRPAVSAGAADERLLRRDVRLLCWELARMVRAHGTGELLDLSAGLVELARQRREGDPQAAGAMERKLAELDVYQLQQLVRMQGCYLELMNLAEDRHRARVLRQRDDAAFPAPRGESIGAAVDALCAAGLSPEQMQDLLDKLDICPVFTAHPTEAKRVTLRRLLGRMRETLQSLDRRDLLRRQREDLLHRLQGDLMCFWESETFRPLKPSVLDEVSRNLYVAGMLWQVVPQLFRDLRSGLVRNYGNYPFRVARFVRFGTWIGGDRDGNPFVTAEVTRQTLELLRGDALRRHLESCRELGSRLSLSDRYHTTESAVAAAVREFRQQFPDVDRALARCHPREFYRQWLLVVEMRLEATLRQDAEGSAHTRGMPRAPDYLPDLVPAYDGPEEFAGDIQRVADTLRDSGHKLLADEMVQEWLDRIAVLGFHTAELDIREESGRLSGAVQELAAELGLCIDFGGLREDRKQAFLLTEPARDAVRRLAPERLSPAARETLELFRLLARTSARYGTGPLGALIVSMTHHASDVLAMVWLSRLGAAFENVGHVPLPILPLLETIDDLIRADRILRDMFGQPSYLAYLERLGRNQVCMIGYSDSVKDGGYIAANWELYDAQQQLAQLAGEFNVNITFFHGRGGALGRGGGPAAQAVLSLPPASVGGRLRVTEQGEVVAERYGDPLIAHRHLEQLTWATMLVSSQVEPPPDPRWFTRLSAAAKEGCNAYRRLVEDPEFTDYFNRATPIEAIESLRIGSRPSRRNQRASLEQLRAIPYTFAWTQSRHLITGFYGLGSGLAACCPGDWQALTEMYRGWSFFRALIDNAELALSKADPGIVRHYASMVEDPATTKRILGQIESEHQLTRQAILRIKQRSELLETTPWLKRSVASRNPRVDLLNFVQVELLRRRLRLADQPADDAEALAETLRSSVHALSTGLRTTG
jgi:phosphoenolpyruvate carboxylase